MKRKILLKAGYILVLLALVFQGCKKEDDGQAAKDQELRQLQAYIEDNNITQEPTASGLYYIELSEGTGREAADTYIADFEYTAVLLDGTLIYTSNEELAIKNDVFDSQKIYGPIRVQIGSSGIPGLDEGLPMMKEGGKSEMIMPSSINGFGAQTIGSSGPYSTHIYTVDLVNTFDDPVAFQDTMIASFIAEHETDSFHVSESGLYYSIDSAGDGELISDGNLVELWYTGYFLDGRVFDSNLGTGLMSLEMPATGYIPAWDEALRLMRKGAEFTFIIPYQLGYGPYAQGQIPAYQTLVFDIKIYNVVTGN
ncbi:MAG TPA: hypothetical protein ENI20_19415 [Bacteroides sp.]|nr:hypothetical protein [Bacteroides sp.]